MENSFIWGSPQDRVLPPGPAAAAAAAAAVAAAGRCSIGFFGSQNLRPCYVSDALFGELDPLAVTVVSYCPAFYDGR